MDPTNRGARDQTRPRDRPSRRSNRRRKSSPDARSTCAPALSTAETIARCDPRRGEPRLSGTNAAATAQHKSTSLDDAHDTTRRCGCIRAPVSGVMQPGIRHKTSATLHHVHGSFTELTNGHTFDTCAHALRVRTQSSPICCSRAAVRSTPCAALSPRSCFRSSLTDPGGLSGLGEVDGLGARGRK